MILKKLWTHYGPNPLDRILKKARKARQTKFLIVWNRGLGDVPLGLYALICRIKMFVPEASMTFLTRKDLKEIFALLENVDVIVDEKAVRGVPIDVESALNEKLLTRADFDVILEKPDPTRWLSWQLGKVVPKLKWNCQWDSLAEQCGLQSHETYLGVHVQTETGIYYGYEKNWPLPYWKELFEKIARETQVKVVLFGLKRDPLFEGDHIVDLRGKSTIFEMLSVIKNRCRYFLGPDSGVLCILYYLNEHFPVRCVSLWADPEQGILRQNVSSPNRDLVHVPLKAEGGKMEAISVKEVFAALFHDKEKNL